MVGEALKRFPSKAIIIVFQRNPTKKVRLITYDNSKRLFSLALQDAGLPTIQMVESNTSRGFLETLDKHGVSRVVRGVRGRRDLPSESVLRYFLPASYFLTCRAFVGVSVVQHNVLGSSTQVRHLLLADVLDRATLNKLVFPSVAIALSMAHDLAPPAQKGRQEFNDALTRVLETMRKASLVRQILPKLKGENLMP